MIEPLVFSAVIVLGVVALLWRQTASLERLSGQSQRERDRERHDSFSMLQKLIERTTTIDLQKLNIQHGNERLQQMQTDLQMERDARLQAEQIVKPVTKDVYDDDGNFPHL
jgi:hypothetical protein